MISIVIFTTKLFRGKIVAFVCESLDLGVKDGHPVVVVDLCNKGGPPVVVFVACNGSSVQRADTVSCSPESRCCCVL